MEKFNAGADNSSESLARELNHRVRNMLQIVMGLCNQTLRQSEDLKQFETLFLGRVQALARVYEVLQRAGWSRVSVHELIDGVVSRVLKVGHYELEGERAYLAADAATGFGLVIHEIAEGARQRGVAGPSGKLNVRWEVTSDEGGVATSQLNVHWREYVQAAMDRPMTNTMRERLQRQLHHELSGSIHFEEAPDGFYIKLVLPLGAMQAMH